MRIVIIEDEPIAANELLKSIQLIGGDYQIICILSSVSESIEYFRNNDNVYDLIFTDVQLGDGLCFDIFYEIDLKKPIIFCTAYNDYLMDAFTSNGIDYILKPYNKERIEKAISKYELLFGINKDIITKKNESLFNLNKEINKGVILIYQKDRIKPLNISEIALFTLKDNFLKIYCFNGSNFIIGYSLEEIEKIVDENFYRANRQNIINVKAIKDLEKLFNRKIKLNLIDKINEEIIISKDKANNFLNWLTSKK